MTFLSDLARLREEPKTPSEYVSYGLWLVDRAEAIEELVRAADGHGCGWKIDDPRSNGPCAICKALEKMNRSE